MQQNLRNSTDSVFFSFLRSPLQQEEQIKEGFRKNDVHSIRTLKNSCSHEDEFSFTAITYPYIKKVH